MTVIYRVTTVHRFPLNSPTSQLNSHVKGCLVKQSFDEASRLWESGHKGKPVNRGGDFGLEVLCEYISEGDDLSCECLHGKDRREI